MQTIKIIRDRKGRKTGKRVTIEPEWDDEDRALIAGLLMYESDLCPGCGMHSSETMWRIPEQSDEAIIEYFNTHPKAQYHAGFYVCRGCVAKEKAMNAQSKIDEQRRKTPGMVLYPEARRWFTISRGEMMDPKIDVEEG